jgi:cytochrome c551
MQIALQKILYVLLALTLICCSKRSGKKEFSSPKMQQYYLQGEQLFIKYCSNCHQTNGRGLGLLYPPLDTSDFMDKNMEEVICLIKHGKKGALTVNGKAFNQPMPGINTLSDLEIAEIATYIYNTWSHDKGMIDVQRVSKILSSCKP